ncbi:GNAT family N-acetyltransferase [Bacillus sp. Y1]|nr:GNAT family N-acetyltransferase [Bacillus sp. Y1]AYA75673.1 GNAT family N-acetyltransferase [Bacillus sp. Y1]
MEIKNGKLTIRPLGKEDVDHLSKWLSNPTVLEYYEGRDQPFSVEKVMQTFFLEEEGLSRYIFLFEEKPIGYIQTYTVEDEKVKTFGMDQFIGETDYWNKGIGTILIHTMVNYLVNSMSAERIIMDPHTSNKRALRCYEKCGFRKVKLLSKHELHEGEFRDCWLIELIIER